MKYFLIVFVGLLVVLIFDVGILINQEKSMENSSVVLECKYISAKGFDDRSYWYAPNNILGKDKCPFVKE